jgi:hypothetical protein
MKAIALKKCPAAGGTLLWPNEQFVPAGDVLQLARAPSNREILIEVPLKRAATA